MFLVDPEDRAVHDTFTWIDVTRDIAMLLVGALVFGVCGSKCLGYGWNWRVAAGCFVLGMPVIFVIHREVWLEPASVLSEQSFGADVGL